MEWSRGPQGIGEQIVATLAQRIGRAKAVLGQALAGERLHYLLNQCGRWAIVGGAVRDSLLLAEPGNVWRDLDIALLDDDAQLVRLRRSLLEADVAVTANSFGGLKVRTRQAGIVDIWVWPATRGRGVEDVLGRVDFGVNAVAFSASDCQINMHERWLRDVESLEVERLWLSADRWRATHVFRAVALAQRLSQALETDVRLGQLMEAEITWVARTAEFDVLATAISYAGRKVAEGRWSETAIQRLLETVYRSVRPPVRHELLALWRRAVASQEEHRVPARDEPRRVSTRTHATTRGRR